MAYERGQVIADIRMSIADTYRRKVETLSREITDLFSNRAREQRSVGDIQAKIASANQAKARATSSASARSKQRDIDRFESELQSRHRKLADIDTKIARKQKEKSDTEERLSREYLRDAQRRERETAEQERVNQSKMSRVVSTIADQDRHQRQMEGRLSRLESLPEKVGVVVNDGHPTLVVQESISPDDHVIVRW